MAIRSTLQSQYRASLQMLEQAMRHCPDSLWDDRTYNHPFWHVAFHVLFYTHFYLQPSEEDFVPWQKHRDALVSLDSAARIPEDLKPYTKEDLLSYVAYCLEQVTEQVSSIDLGGASGFYWLPFDKLELQIYNIRHIQQHTGELCERLSITGSIEVDWVGMRSE